MSGTDYHKKTTEIILNKELKPIEALLYYVMDIHELVANMRQEIAEIRVMLNEK